MGGGSGGGGMKPPTKHRVTFLSVRSFARLTAAPALRGVCPGAFPAVRCRYLSAPPDGTALPPPPLPLPHPPPLRVRPPGSPRTSKRSGMGHLRTWGGLGCKGGGPGGTRSPTERPSAPAEGFAPRVGAPLNLSSPPRHSAEPLWERSVIRLNRPEIARVCVRLFLYLSIFSHKTCIKTKCYFSFSRELYIETLPF